MAEAQGRTEKGWNRGVVAEVGHTELSDGEGRPAANDVRTGPVGLVRDRLTARLLDPSTYRVGWVVAPAGSGKSRLLSHVADEYTGPLGWCDTPDPVPRTEAALVTWIWEGLRTGGVEWATGGAPEDLEALISAGRPGPQPLIIVMDDVHLLEGSEAETAVGTLVGRLPAGWRLVMASRVNLSMDLSRLRVSGDVVDIGPDDLRFRTWEVEELFRDVYQEPLLPEDVAALTRRTSGWAAYLQMFFLATSRRTVAERRTVLGTLQHRTRLVSEYLARHVLAGLDPALQDFLIRTSVLRRPSGRLCDEFLGWSSGSAELLAELERRQLFTERLADDSYRYHAVLVSYLDAKLVETIGLPAAKEEHRRAGRLLEKEGWREEAMAAYARAEDWEGVARILGHPGAGHVDLDEAWAEALPSTVLESDPLLLMAQARTAVSRGCLEEAARILRRAEEVAASAAVAGRCRAQREQIMAWAEPDRTPQPDWIGLIRRATQRHPAEARRLAAAQAGVTGRFAEGLCAFLAGDVLACSRIMRSVAGHPDAPGVVVVGGVFLSATCGALLGRPLSPEVVGRLKEEVEVSGVRWLSRIVRAGLQSDDLAGDETLDDIIAACEREGDRWGQAAVSAIAGIRRLLRGDREAEERLTAAAASFQHLGAGVLETWLLAYAGAAALGRGSEESARNHASRARTMSSALDVPVAGAVAYLVLGALGQEPEGRGLARGTIEPCGTWPWHSAIVPGERVAAAERLEAAPSQSRARGEAGRDGVPARVRCLGGYEIEIRGSAVDESAAKPMERALLHLLSIRAGADVHRESLVASLWPDADAEAGLHRLQVAVSSLRRLLSAAGLDGNEMVVRSGDSYRLSLPEGSKVDVSEFEQAVGRAESARAAADAAGERRALEEALALYGGPLLPGDGPVEWAVEPRRWLARLYTDVAARLASLLLEEDEPRQAVRVARAGLVADRYRDELWKLLIDGAERAGNHAEAEQARRDYETVLADLGV